jgi:hypothetical protein
MKPLVDGAQSGIRSVIKRHQSVDKEQSVILLMMLPLIKRANQNPTMSGNVLECPQEERIICVENAMLEKLFLMLAQNVLQ